MTSIAKELFQADFEIHGSAKILFPFLQTAGGLAQWFADDVTISSDKAFTFTWDNEVHIARIVSSRNNQYVRFEYLPESDDDKEDPAYFELRLKVNELTQSTFMEVSDYSGFGDMDELMQIWEGMIENLKGVVGR